ncbi:hypothetical protein [Streptomyces xanthophaeus]|uniref:hypothetical protein n=1 Tax=Streptomyces xanthophaeus TaxID=67385 RepID=UPI00233EF2B2|nr:hypothetical protein [Streptomyces xanthophaeus]
MRRRSNSAADNCLGCIGLIVLLIIGYWLIRNVHGPAGDVQPRIPEPLATVAETETLLPAPAATRTDESGTGPRDGIQFGYACSPVGVLGNAQDGRPAKCFMGKDGRARWGYDSNRG